MKTCDEIESLVRGKLKSHSDTVDWFIVSVTMDGGFDVIVQVREDVLPWWRFTLPAEPWCSDAQISDAFDASLRAWVDRNDVTKPDRN
jgi:hypothetical protein